jgi:hypothetical protein
VDKSEEIRVVETSHALGYPLRKIGHRGSRVFLVLAGALSSARDLPMVEPGRSPK